jgi:LacI family transcriptional regulator
MSLSSPVVLQAHTFNGMANASEPLQPTVEDVARAAGVSTATVSRALNRPQDVRPALRERVRAAVEQLGYVAHAGARALSLRRSHTVGVVVPTVDNAIFATGLQAFQRRMVQEGYLVLLAVSDYDPVQEQAQALALLARGVDALALTGLSQQPELMSLLQQRGLPWVHTGAFPAPKGAACVGFRNREAMAQVVRYLIDLGHRRIGMLAGVTRHNDRAAERVAGVAEAMAAARVAWPAELLAESPYELAAARAGARGLLARQPTALLCGNDVLAWGVLLECQAQGIAVPAQMSVVGFDDLELSRHWQPGLTTVRVPTEPMWTRAADYLLARLEGSLAEPLQLEVAVELIVRGSTAPPAHKPRSTRRRPSAGAAAR